MTEEMSCQSNLTQFPNEILLMIFNHLDTGNLTVAGQVCKRWSDIVQIFHDESWRSLTEVVMLKAGILRPKFGSRGWVEQEHDWNTCNCFNIARELIFYEDIELLINDLESLDEDWIEISGLKKAEAISRLAAAKIITSIDNLQIFGFIYDLSSLKNLSHLLRIVKDGLYLINVTINDIPTFFSHIRCTKLDISMLWDMDYFSDKDIESLTEVLNNKVEQFTFESDCCKFPYIENYNGEGKCREIHFGYNDSHYVYDEEFASDLPKIQEWANSKGWTVEDIKNTDLELNLTLRRN